jgi:hypothetical protein
MAELTLYIQEYLPMSDSTAQAISDILIQEHLPMEDFVRIEMQYNRTIQEHLPISDSVSLAATYALTIQEYLPISDSVSFQKAMALHITERLKLKDSVFVGPSLTLTAGTPIAVPKKQAITAGKSYFGSVFYRHNGTIPRGKLRLAFNWYTAADVLITINALDFLPIDAEWTQQWLLATAPMNAATMTLTLEVPPNMTLEIPREGIYFTKFKVEEQQPDQDEPSIFIDDKTELDIHNRVVQGFNLNGVAIKIGRFSIEDIAFTDNSPVAGSVSWTGGTIYKNGTAYSIAAGNTNLEWIYWNVGDATFTTASTKPVKAKRRYIICRNENGTAYEKFDSTLIENRDISDIISKLSPRNWIYNADWRGARHNDIPTGWNQTANNLVKKGGGAAARPQCTRVNATEALLMIHSDWR